MRSTHTFATLAVSREVYDEIRVLLEEAGYHHAFIGDAIDMTGIGLIADPNGLAASENEGKARRREHAAGGKPLFRLRARSSASFRRMVR